MWTQSFYIKAKPFIANNLRMERTQNVFTNQLQTFILISFQRMLLSTLPISCTIQMDQLNRSLYGLSPIEKTRFYAALNSTIRRKPVEFLRKRLVVKFEKYFAFL